VPFIAVVDDEEPIRKALKRLLRAAGLEAEGYASGQAFLDGAAARRPDCVLLDLHMPSMSGEQVLSQIRKMSGRPPVVVITAHDTPETREQLLAGEARHVQVEQYAIWRLRYGAVEKCLAACVALRLEAGSAQQPLQRLADRFLIIHDGDERHSAADSSRARAAA